ncbi:MAG TPA: HAMP domain-containing sensor histidine kinase [Streptosporangiaceae bacterium]|nr:HAMP domain-containing sensor histidine kinase [Streptosporangiaceae bacterium]
MTHPATGATLRQRLRGLPSRTPLRIKLIAAMLALVTVALTVISIAGIFVLRGYLLGQADEKLIHAAHHNDIPTLVAGYLAQGEQTPSNNNFSVEWLPASGKAQMVAIEYAGLHNGQPTHPVPGPDARQGASWLNLGIDTPVTVRAMSGDTRWRVVSAAISLTVVPGENPVNGTIILGYDVTSIYKTINELTIIDLIISGVLLIVLTILGITVIRSSMRPLNDIEQTAEAIAAGDLGRRVPENDPRTEVGRLGRSLNTMLAHIESSFRARTASEEAARRSEEAARYSALSASRSEDRMRRFVADASHELRTPLTAIRGYAEYYRQRGGIKGGVLGGATAAATRGAGGNGSTAAFADEQLVGGLSRGDLDHLITRVEQEAKRMGVLVDDLLLLARLDQQRPLEFRTVDVLAIAADAMHDARVIAPDRAISLTVGSPDAALVLGDEVGLRQVVGNLMTNAMMHTPGGTPVDITIRVGKLGNDRAPADPGEPAVILEVTDQGPGLTDDQKEHVFERFYRTDRSRSRAAGGTGLGLAIVASMVKAHDGKVWVDSRPGGGATFGFALPLAPEARLSPSDAGTS